MKREDILKIIPDATEEQIEAILNGTSASIEKFKKDSEAAKTRVKELEDANKALEEEASKGKTAEEKYQDALNKAGEAEKNYQRQLAMLDVKSAYIEAGLNKEQYEPLLESVTSDHDISMKFATSIISAMKSTAEVTEATVKKQLLEKFPKLDQNEDGVGKGDAGESSQESSVGQKLAAQTKATSEAAKTAIDYYVK